MAMTGIRSFLKQKGINESDIVYDPVNKRVKVNGFDYGPVKPTFQTQYQSQPLSDLTRNYVPKTLNTGVAGKTEQFEDAFQRQGIQQADQKRQQAMTNYEKLLSQPYQPGQFTYNQSKDPAYQAALQSAQMNIRDAQVRNMGEMQRRGILNSSITTDRADQIAADELARVATQVAPQLESQAYNRFLQSEQQKYNSWQDMVKLANSRLDLAQGVYNERNTTYQNARKEQEARAMANRELLQRQAEAQAKAQQAADEMRMKQAESDREYNLKLDKFKFDKEQANKPKLTAGAGGSGADGSTAGGSTKFGKGEVPKFMDLKEAEDYLSNAFVGKAGAFVGLMGQRTIPKNQESKFVTTVNSLGLTARDKIAIYNGFGLQNQASKIANDGIYGLAVSNPDQAITKLAQKFANNPNEFERRIAYYGLYNYYLSRLNG